MKELKLAYEEINLHYDIIENMLTLQDRYANYREKATACHKLASYSKISSSLAASMEKLDLSPLTLDVQSAYTLSTEGFWQTVKNFFKAIGHYFKRLFLAIFAKDYRYDKIKKIGKKLDGLADTLQKSIDVKKDIVDFFENIEEINKIDKALAKPETVVNMANDESISGKQKDVAKLKYKMITESFIDVLLECRYKMSFHNLPSTYISDFSNCLDTCYEFIEIFKKFINVDVNDEYAKNVDIHVKEFENAVHEIEQKPAISKEVLEFVKNEVNFTDNMKSANIDGYVVDGKKLGLITSGEGENDGLIFSKNIELKSIDPASIKEDFIITSDARDVKLLKLRIDIQMKTYNNARKSIEVIHKEKFKAVETAVKYIETGLSKYESMVLKYENQTDKDKSNEFKEAMKAMRAMINVITKTSLPYLLSSIDAAINTLERHIVYLTELIKIYGLTDENMNKLNDNIEKSEELDKDASTKREEIDKERGK